MKTPKLTPLEYIAAFICQCLICWPVVALILHNFNLLKWSKAFVVAVIMSALMDLCRLALPKMVGVALFWTSLIFGALHFVFNFVTR